MLNKPKSRYILPHSIELELNQKNAEQADLAWNHKGEEGWVGTRCSWPSLTFGCREEPMVSPPSSAPPKVKNSGGQGVTKSPGKMFCSTNMTNHIRCHTPDLWEVTHS